MKSFILSAILIVVPFLFFMSVFDTKISAWYRQWPDWIFITALVLLFAGYLLSLYWGITGLRHGSRFLNILGMGTSLLGIGIFALFFFMNKSGGKERRGQFDHELAKIEPTQLAVISELLTITHTDTAAVNMVAYWQMHQNPGNFVICIQQGNIIALQVTNKQVSDLRIVSKLKHLNWLALENCGLTSLTNLDLPLLQRLSIKHNQVSSLAGLENAPQLGWLNYHNNPVTDSAALTQLPKQVYILHE